MLNWTVLFYRTVLTLTLCIAQPAGAVEPPANGCPVYATEQSDGEVPVMLGLWGMRSTPSLQLLSGQLLPGIKLNCILMLNWIVWIRIKLNSLK